MAICFARNQKHRPPLGPKVRLRRHPGVPRLNTTVEGTYREQRFTILVDSNASEARDLVSGKMIDLSKPVELGPRTTLVLYLGQ